MITVLVALAIAILIVVATTLYGVIVPIILLTGIWIVAASALYGVLVGKTVAEVRQEAAVMACVSGMAACVLAAMLAELTR